MLGMASYTIFVFRAAERTVVDFSQPINCDDNVMITCPAHQRKQTAAYSKL